MPHEKMNQLHSYISLLSKQKATPNDFEKVKPYIEELTVMDCFALMDARRLEKESHEFILSYLDRVLLTFYPVLKRNDYSIQNDTFIEHLHLENEAFLKHLESIKVFLKDDGLKRRHSLKVLFEACEIMNVHYLKKENILFPLLEMKKEELKGLTLMWSLHNQIKATLKQLLHACEHESDQRVSQLIGQYFLQAIGLVQKETYILFPTSSLLSINEHESMREQSFEYGFAWIKTPTFRKIDSIHTPTLDHVYTTQTGVLSFEQLTRFLNLLPLDCTIVDEHDKVIYFNNPKERFFPRSAAVLGRDVVNCHPGHSVHMVMAILEAFRKNERNEATFWINFKGKKLYIQYLAMRDDQGNYKGVVELTQDISSFIGLEGEKRLLNWE